MNDRKHMSVLVGAAGVAALGLGVAFVTPMPNASNSETSAYQNCIAAANAQEGGFATEVCEPLVPNWEEPVAYVHRKDFTARPDGCLFFTYLTIHGEEYGDPGDGEYYCPR